MDSGSFKRWPRTASGPGLGFVAKRGILACSVSAHHLAGRTGKGVQMPLDAWDNGSLIGIGQTAFSGVQDSPPFATGGAPFWHAVQRAGLSGTHKEQWRPLRPASPSPWMLAESSETPVPQSEISCPPPLREAAAQVLLFSNSFVLFFFESC